MKRCFLTGCDSNTEWMLPWFLGNYRKHNDTPIVVADFGMTTEARNCARENSDFVFPLFPSEQHSGWMLKPEAMVHSPAEETCWIDTDCEVLGDISGIFDHIVPLKLTMVEDRPWSKRSGQKWHNSGVVAFKGKPRVLLDWSRMCQEKADIRGDQEVLHWMMGGDLMRRMSFIEDLPHKYNTLRLDVVDGIDVKNKLVMHHTGQKGKQRIKELMQNE